MKENLIMQYACGLLTAKQFCVLMLQAAGHGVWAKVCSIMPESVCMYVAKKIK